MVKRPTPRLDKLRNRIRRLTTQRGAQAGLAAWLGVTPQRLNDWLSGDSEPGGETTLHLLEWATAEEVTQKKSAARVTARATPKARTVKSDERKANTSQRRK